MQGLLFWWWLSGRWVVAFVMFELAGRRRASLRGRLRTVSLFSWSVEQNARDTQMTTRETGEAFFSCYRPRFSRLAALPLNARARALPFLNLKKQRDRSRSTWEVTRERHANGDASVRGENWKGTFHKIPFLHDKLRTSVIVRRAYR